MYTCENSTGRLVSFDTDYLYKDCNKKKFNLQDVILGSSLPLLFAVVILVSLYLQRWKIRWHIFKLKKYGIRYLCNGMNRGGLLDADGNNMATNVFILTSQDARDKDWVDHQLMEHAEGRWGWEVMLPHREGQYAGRQLLDMVDECGKVIIVLTVGFLEDRQCDYIAQMIFCEKGLDNVTVCQADDVRVQDMTRFWIKQKDGPRPFLIFSYILNENNENFWLDLKDAVEC